MVDRVLLLPRDERHEEACIRSPVWSDADAPSGRGPARSSRPPHAPSLSLGPGKSLSREYAPKSLSGRRDDQLAKPIVWRYPRHAAKWTAAFQAKQVPDVTVFGNHPHEGEDWINV